MSSHPPSPLPERMKLFFDFPVRLYTALRTIRLYPVSNPQVQRSIDFVRRTFKVLLESGIAPAITLALVDHKILVCGEFLPDKDQAHPQIQGLVTLLKRLNIHSLTFQPNFILDDCVKFIQILSLLVNVKHHTEPITTLLTRAGISSVAVDADPVVVTDQDDQDLPKELTDSGLTLSDEEEANFISNLLRQGEEDTANNLLMHWASALQHQESMVQTNAVLSLASAAEQLDAMGQWQRLHKLLPALQQGLLHKGANEQSIRQTIAAIGGLIRHCLIENNYAQAFETTYLLRSLALLEPSTAGFNPLIREHALATLKSLSSQSFLKHLLDLYLRSESQQEMAGQLLLDLGPESTRFQLQQLMRSESRFERKRLLALIKRTGSPATAILLQELQREAPWFVIRNIIHLLGEIGNPSLLREIRPFIRHADLRVQQEVIKAAVQIGGENLKNFLFVALQTVDDSLKVKVVHHLAAVADERFVRPLTDLLESTKSFHGKNRDSLQLAICKILGMMGSTQATTSLNRVAQSKKIFGLGGYSEEVRQAARLALEQIDKGSTTPAGREPDQKMIPREHKDPAMPPTVTPPSQVDEEAAIFALATRGQRDSAKQRLLDLITTTARTGDFQTAERLRERMYEIDPLALNEIIRAGELIEQEKRGAIKEDDLEIWAELTDRLSSEEFSTMYHEFSERRFQTEETIVNQGDKNEALFFITQGSVKVSSRVGPREIFITSLNRGQIAGENFFTPSFWTVSLTSLTPVRVYILEQATLAGWREKFPGLRAKLHEYYNSCNNIRSMLKKKGLERRKGQRFNLSRKIQIQPISSLDAPIGQGFRAELLDISLGGLAFIIRISKQESARLLLGRRMQVVLPVGGTIKYLYFKGLVVSVQPFHLLENDFSVHFRFDQPMEQQGLQSILG